MKLRAKSPKKKHRWSLTVAWIVLMMILSMTVTVVAEMDLSATVGVTGLTVNSTGKTDWSASAGKASWEGSTTKNGCNVYPTSGTLVLKNDSGSDKVLSFTYSITLGNGSVKIDGISVSSGSTYKKALANGKTVTIEVATDAAAAGTTKLELSNIELNVPDVTVTFEPAASGGSYTLGGTAVNTTTEKTAPATTSYELVAIPSANCVFAGWYLNDDLYYTGEKLTTAFPNGGTVTAKFVTDPLYSVAKAAEGQSLDSLLEINSRYYHDPKNTMSTSQISSLTFCYYSVAATTGVGGDYDVQYVPFLEWTTTENGIQVSRSGEAHGDYYPGGTAILGANSWSYTNMVANVIRIKAKENCVITFDYKNKAGMTTDQSEADLPYLWLYQSNSETATINQIQGGTKYNSTSGSVEVTVAAGKYLYICMHGRGVGYTHMSTGGYGKNDFNYSGSISNFQVSYNQQTWTHTSVFQDNTGKPLTGGKLTVNGTSYTADANGKVTGITQPEGQSMKLSVATAPKNYKLLGWLVGDKILYQTTYEYTLDKDTEIHPVFVPNVVTYDANDGTYTYLNTESTGVAVTSEYIARDTTATQYYSTLETAFGIHDEVVLLANMSIKGDYTIPDGKTLIVPANMTAAPAWDSTNKWYNTETEPTGSRSAYATLTLEGDITVAGALVADGGQSKSNSSLSGSYGMIDVKGTVTVPNGGELYGFGVIKGTGTIDSQTKEKVEGTGIIYAKSGSKIHETLEMMDLRHPVTLKYLADDAETLNTFPFNSIYIYSIEAEVVYDTGADMYAHYFSEYTGQGAFHIIGSTDEQAMFLIHSGTVTKSYTNGHMLIRINQGANVSTGVMKQDMTGSAYGFDQTITIDTSKFLIPLTSAYQIEVCGNFAVDYSYKFLPGAILDVKSTGEVVIGENANVVFYRLNDYDYRRLSSMSDTSIPTGFSVNGYPINYSRYSPFAIGSVGSAKLNVDGTLIVKGGLYVTNQLIPEGSEKYTHYDNGYNFLTGTGSIDVSGAKGKLKTINENLTYTSTPELHITTVEVITIKGLNPEATADVPDQYSQLTGVMYGRTNGNGLNVWTSNPCQFGHTFIYDGAVPTYTWAEDNSYVTAEVTCKYCNEKLTEKVDTSFATVTEANCKTEGAGTYTATFTNAAFTEQTKNVVIPITPHTPGDPADCDSDQICTVCKDVLEAAKGHTKGEDVVTIAATCTEKGSVSYTCTTCQTLIVEELPALGGYHLWVNGECDKPNCDAKFLFTGTNIAVNEGLDMYFYVNAADVADTDTAFYAVVTKVFADGRPDSVATIPMNKSDADNVAGWQAVEDADTGEVVQYRFAFTDIAAKEMMDGITAVVCYKNGENVVQASKAYTGSVWTYAENAYKMYGEAQPELATALADMLNYGAACQIVFEYDAGNLANANMSAEWRGKATTAVPSLTATERKKGTYFYGSTFSAENKLMYTFYFDFSAFDKNGNGKIDEDSGIGAGAYAMVTYFDPDNTADVVETKVAFEDWYGKTATIYGVDVTGIPVMRGRNTVTCTVYDSNGTEISTGNVDSIVGYASRIDANKKQDQYNALAGLLRFVDSAKTYFMTEKV